MKLVVSFYGMCLCVLDRREGNRAAGATVLLLNGAAPSSRACVGAVEFVAHAAKARNAGSRARQRRWVAERMAAG